METFYERVKMLCDERNVKITNLAKDLGLSTSLPTNWKNGIAPSADNIIKIADYFNCSADYLLGRSDIKKILHIDNIYKDIIATNSTVGHDNSSLTEQANEEDKKAICDYLALDDNCKKRAQITLKNLRNNYYMRDMEALDDFVHKYSGVVQNSWFLILVKLFNAMPFEESGQWVIDVCKQLREKGYDVDTIIK